MGRPSNYTRESRVYDFVAKVPYSSKYARPDVLPTIARAVQDSGRTLADFTQALSGLHQHLNGTFDAFVDNLYALAKKPIKDGPCVVEPHKVVLRLSQEYATGRPSECIEDMLKDGEVDPQRIWSILKGIRENQFQHGAAGNGHNGSTHEKEGCRRARAYGTRHCANRWIQKRK